MSLEDSTLHTVARTAAETLGGPVQSFTPVNQIHRAFARDAVWDGSGSERA